MLQASPPSRAKAALVVAMILLPLGLIAVVKYVPAMTAHETISTVAIVYPRLYVPEEYNYLNDDVVKRLRDELAGMDGVGLRETPPASATAIGADLAKAARTVGAEALIIPSITIDAGLVQLNLQIVDPGTNEILFNTPYQSSLARYPDMIRAAAAGLKRALAR